VTIASRRHSIGSAYICWLTHASAMPWTTYTPDNATATPVMPPYTVAGSPIATISTSEPT